MEGLAYYAAVISLLLLTVDSRTLPEFTKLAQLRTEDSSENEVSFHNISDADIESPSDFLSHIHSPEQQEVVIHQISTKLLDVTKELLSFTPRGVSSNSTIEERLRDLQKLDPRSVQTLVARRSVAIPEFKGIQCGPNTLHYRTMDGSCNNLKNPCWGKSHEAYQRFLPPAYADGLQEPRRLKHDGTPLPCPRKVYNWVSSQLVETPNTTYSDVSNTVALWGQMLAHDILLTPTATVPIDEGVKGIVEKAPDCCRMDHAECIPIKLDYDDVFFPRGHCMDIIRSSAYTHSPTSCEPLTLGKPREQMNQLTSFIDGSLVYGTNYEQCRELRENNGLSAKLKMDYATNWACPPRKERPCKVSHTACDKRCFLAGERRANENPFLSALHTLWNREHNRIVDVFRTRRWDEETKFHVTRKIIGALMQHITFNEFLPVVIGSQLTTLMNLRVPTSTYLYHDDLNPTLYNGFITAAFRFGHSMISSRNMRGGLHSSLAGSPLLSQDFFSMDDFCGPRPRDPVAQLLSGGTSQRAQRVDSLFSKQLTNHLFAKTFNGIGMDLYSLNLQRGRDHGIPPYNRWRQACSLKVANEYSDLRGDIPDHIIDRLAAVYGPGGVHDIDLYVGGVSEFPANDGLLGPTFTCIVANQFRNLKFGDRFWYENLNHPGAFTQDQIKAIQKTTLASLLCRNSGVGQIQRSVFHVDSFKNPVISCEDIKKENDLDLNMWP